MDLLCRLLELNTLSLNKNCHNSVTSNRLPIVNEDYTRRYDEVK